MGLLNPYYALCAVGFLARFSYALARTPVLPLFALHLGAGPEAIGLVVGISTVTGIFFKLPAGAASDLIGRKKTLLAGLVVFAVMPFTYLLVSSSQLLMLIRFLHGFATAIYGPVAMAVVMDAAGGRKGEMLSWFSSVTIIGNLVGAPAGGFILYRLATGAPSLFDFQAVYLASGAAGLLALLLALAILRGREAVAPSRGLREALRRFSSGIREVLSDRRVVAASSMEGLQNLTVGALEAFLPIYAVKVAELNEFQAGLLWGVQVLVTILSKPVLGRTSDLYGRRPLIVGGMALCALSFGAIPLVQNFYLLLITAAFFGLGEALVTSSSAALVADICHQRHFGAAMGAFGTIFDVGHAAGPIVAGLLLARMDYLPSFWIMAAALLASIPVFLWTVTHEGQAGGTDWCKTK
ncbi:MAG: MFS transporter [Deltaproteobacteria bacterium]|nr:MAG: MFS transporter [Deltaproteobacteria bacterium]